MAIVALASIRDVGLAKGYDTSAFLLTNLSSTYSGFLLIN